MRPRTPKLVLLPGLDGTGDLFMDFVRALHDTFETEVVRYPANRLLSNSELATIIHSSTLTSESFFLVAESFSTPLAIQYASTNPPRLKGLILCAGFATSPAEGWIRRAYSVLSPVLFRMPLPEFVARLALVGPNAPASLVVSLRAAISSVEPKVLSGRIRAVLQCDVRPELARVEVPILYLQASQDRLVGTSSVKEIQRIRPKAVVEIFAGPHLLMQREPQQTAAAVVRFVQQLS